LNIALNETMVLSLIVYQI